MDPPLARQGVSGVLTETQLQSILDTQTQIPGPTLNQQNQGTPSASHGNPQTNSIQYGAQPHEEQTYQSTGTEMRGSWSRATIEE